MPVLILLADSLFTGDTAVRGPVHIATQSGLP